MHGKALQHFSANQNVTWTQGEAGGTFSNITSNAADWTAPNIGGTYKVRATNGASQFSEVTIVVTGVVPQGPSWEFTVVSKKKVLLFEPEVGDRQTRTKRGKKRTFEVTTNRRKKVHWAEMEAFWDAEYPGNKVYLTHPGSGFEMLGWIDSDLKEQWHRTNLVSFSFVFQEA